MKLLKKLTAKETDRLCDLLDEEAVFRLDHDILREFVGKGDVLQCRRGEIINEEGAIDTHVYVIIDGILRRWYWNGDNEITTAFGLPGSMFIYYHSYCYNQSPQFFYEACCKSRILRVTKEDYDSMLRTYHDFSLWCLNMAQCQFYYYEKKESVINGNVEERYASIEQNRPEILQNVSLRIIASYLGVSPQYLSKIRNKKFK